MLAIGVKAGGGGGSGARLQWGLLGLERRRSRPDKGSLQSRIFHINVYNITFLCMYVVSYLYLLCGLNNTKWVDIFKNYVHRRMLHSQISFINFPYNSLFPNIYI